MKDNIGFVGIGIESGQEKSGLCYSSQVARTYLSQISDVYDYGDIISNQTCVKIHNYEDFNNYILDDYFQASQTVLQSLNNHNFTVNWGGDHSIGWSTISAFLTKYPDGIVIWIDAHADLNRPDTSLTGNFHGMPVSFLLGLNPAQTFKELSVNLKPEQLIYIGTRCLDPFEKKIIKILNIKNFDMQFIRLYGIETVLREIKRIVQDRVVHISFDIDSIDPLEAPATGVPVTGGLSLGDLEATSDFLSRKVNYRSLDIVEINPFIDTKDSVEKTYKVAFRFLKKFIFNQRGKYAGKFYSDQRKLSTQTKGSLSIPTKNYL